MREAPPLSFVNEMLQKRDLISQVSFFLQVFPAKELRDREKLGGFLKNHQKCRKNPRKFFEAAGEMLLQNEGYGTIIYVILFS